MTQSLLRMLFLVIVGLFPVGQFERILLPSSTAIYVHEVVMALFLCVTGIYFLLQKKQVFSYLRGPLFFPWAMGISWILFSVCVVSLTDPLRAVVGMMYLLRFCLYVLFAAATYALFRRHVFPKKILPVIPLVWGVVIAAIGLVQYVLIPDTRGLALLGWDNHYFRLIGTFFDPGFTGILLACCALLFQMRLSIRSDLRTTMLTRMGYLLTAGALLLTYSRASFVAYGAGCLFLALRDRQVRHIFLLVLFGGCMVLLPRPRSEGTRLERTASIISRVETFSDATRTPNVMSFVIGNGWYAAKPLTPRLENGVLIPSHASAPENSYLFIYHSLGVIGVGVLLWCAVATLRSRENPELFVVVVAIATHALFTNTLFYPFVLFMLGVIMAGSERESR